MSKTKSEKILSIEEQIEQLENRRKKLLQEEKAQARKDRTRRLIERGAILESIIDEADALTNDEVKMYLEKTLKTEYARKILSGVKGGNSENPIGKQEKTVNQNSEVSAAKAAEPTQAVGMAAQTVDGTGTREAS
jgi:secreted Zn-dependent insulinase-like peptidase